MIRTLLIATVVVLGMTSSVVGSIIAPPVSEQLPRSLASKGTAAPAESSPTIGVLAADGSLAAIVDPFLGGSGVALVAMSLLHVNIGTLQILEWVLGEVSSRLPTPPIREFLRPPQQLI